MGYLKLRMDKNGVPVTIVASMLSNKKVPCVLMVHYVGLITTNVRFDKPFRDVKIKGHDRLIINQDALCLR